MCSGIGLMQVSVFADTMKYLIILRHRIAVKKGIEKSFTSIEDVTHILMPMSSKLQGNCHYCQSVIALQINTNNVLIEMNFVNNGITTTWFGACAVKD